MSTVNTFTTDPIRLHALPYWSNPPFLIFNIQALYAQDWAPERPNVKN